MRPEQPDAGALDESTPTDQIYTELQEAFDYFNERLFNGEISQVLITMQREYRTLGYFSSKRFTHRTGERLVDEISINPAYFGAFNQIEIFKTLVHEMCHAWQYHHGTPSKRSYHNSEWARKMEEVGLMPSATGRPGGRRTGEKMSEYMIKDGPFHQAAQELMDRGFRVSWIDRLVAVKPTHASLTAVAYEHPDKAAQAQAEDGDALPDEGQEQDQAIEAPDDGFPFTGEPLPQEAPAQGEPLDAGGAMTDDLSYIHHIHQPQPGSSNRSNRSKYRCASCKTQVWGKPGLAVLCGRVDCNYSPLEAVTD